MQELINELNTFAQELRKKEISYTACDKIRLQIESLNIEYNYTFDDLLFRKINKICYDYHHTQIERLDIRYELVGKIYLVVDLLQR